MKSPTRNLEASGETADRIARRVLNALAEGFVLHERRVRSGDGIEGRRINTTWVVKRPVIEDGIISGLVEDDETGMINRVGRLRYGLRPADVDRRMLRVIAPDVHWLGPKGAERAIEEKGTRPFDLWTRIRPCSVNHVPTTDGVPGHDVGVGTDPKTALDRLSRGDGMDAVAAMLEGLHLVDCADDRDLPRLRADRRTWRPMRPVIRDGRVVGYEVDARVARYTTNSGRLGFSQTTFAAISPLLVEAGYDPRGSQCGHAYAIGDQWAAQAAEMIGWTPEVDMVTPPAATIADEAESDDRASPSPREQAILAMLEHKGFDDSGEAPSYAEVAAAIARHGGDGTRMAMLIESAMSQVARAVKAKSVRGSWWKR